MCVTSFRKRLDGVIAKIEQKSETQKEKLNKLQSQIQQNQVKAAMKA